MTVEFVQTEHWLICSPEHMMKFFQFAIKKDGTLNEHLKGQTVLVVDSGLEGMHVSERKAHRDKKMLLPLIQLMEQSYKLGLRFIVLSNNKPMWIDPRIRTLVSVIRKWNEKGIITTYKR